MNNNEQSKIQTALKNAEMSARMEGLELTSHLKKQCIDVITGKKTLQDCLTEINSKYANA